MNMNDLIKKLTDEFSDHTGLDGDDEATPEAITQMHALLTGFLSDAIGEVMVADLLAGASKIIGARAVAKAAAKQEIH